MKLNLEEIEEVISINSYLYGKDTGYSCDVMAGKRSRE
jgi:hypothetical protein